MPAEKEVKKLYTRFAEIGRVVLISYGPEAGKLATIVDIVDANLALVDGAGAPAGPRRQVINFKWLSLTDLKVEKMARNSRATTIAKAWAAQGLAAKWAGSAWGKKLAAKAAKSELTDLGRFKVKLAKQEAAKKRSAA